jgi:hypothetical protein
MYESKYAVCPYYHRHESNRICCEGVDNTNTINLVFVAAKDLKAYGERYCNSISRCSRCMIYQMLERKYPQGEGG